MSAVSAASVPLACAQAIASAAGPPEEDKTEDSRSTTTTTTFVLLALLGASAWMPVQCVFSDAWNLIQELPEGYHLPNNLALAAQCGPLAAALHLYLFRGARSKTSAVLRGTIWVILVGDAVVLAALALTWRLTLLSGGPRPPSSRSSTMDMASPIVVLADDDVPAAFRSIGLYACYILLACFCCLTNLVYWPFVAHVLEAEKVATGVVFLSGGATSSVAVIAFVGVLQRLFSLSPSAYFAIFSAVYAFCFLPVFWTLAGKSRARAAAAAARGEEMEMDAETRRGREEGGGAGGPFSVGLRDEDPSASTLSMSNSRPLLDTPSSEPPGGAPHARPTSPTTTPGPSSGARSRATMALIFIAGAFQNGLFLSLTVFACRALVVRLRLSSTTTSSSPEAVEDEVTRVYFLTTNTAGWLTPFAVALAHKFYRSARIRAAANAYWLSVGCLVTALACGAFSPSSSPYGAAFTSTSASVEDANLKNNDGSDFFDQHSWRNNKLRIVVGVTVMISGMVALPFGKTMMLASLAVPPGRPGRSSGLIDLEGAPRLPGGSSATTTTTRLLDSTDRLSVAGRVLQIGSSLGSLGFFMIGRQL